MANQSWTWAPLRRHQNLKSLIQSEDFQNQNQEQAQPNQTKFQRQMQIPIAPLAIKNDWITEIK